MTKRKWVRVGFDLKPLRPPEPPESARWAIDTKEKAVAHLLAELSPADRAVVRDTPAEDVILFHLGWGISVRKELGLWGQNVHLLRDLSPDRPIHADDASMVLIRAVWERLRAAPVTEEHLIPAAGGRTPAGLWPTRTRSPKRGRTGERDRPAEEGRGMWQRVVGCGLCAAALAGGPVGCQDRAAPGPPAPAPAAAPAAQAAFDESKGYLHQPSGVGFVYPDGWENLGVTDRGPIVSLGLRKREPPIEVTLFWSRPDELVDATAVGQLEYDGLRSVYGDAVGKPEPIRGGDRPGYRLAITGGPLGRADPGLSGVVCVFAVPAAGRPWKIKLRATAAGRDHLTTAEELLKNYRW